MDYDWNLNDHPGVRGVGRTEKDAARLGESGQGNSGGR